METIRINNTILEFNKIIYVDAINGSDEIGDGSKDNPYKTLQVALNYASRGDALYLRKGTYTIRAIHYIFDKKGVDLIGEGYYSNIIIQGNINAYGQYLNGNIENNFYMLRFSVDENYASNATDTRFLYTIGQHSSRTTTYDFGIYNCIFEDAYGILSTQFFSFDGTYSFDVNIAKLDIKNSAFYSSGDINIFNISASQSVINKINVVNVATSTSKITPVSSESFKTNLVNVLFDEKYNITSEGWRNTGTGTNPDGTQAHIGVYGGEFAWRDWKILLKSNNKYYTYQNNEFIEVEPTVENFKEKSILLSDLITPTNRVVLTMEEGEDLGDGKIFRKTINVNKYKDIENIYIIIKEGDILCL